LCLASILPAHAAEDVSLADLKAATRSLGFLQNLPHAGDFIVGIVYAPGSAGAKALALQAAERIRTLPGPKDTSLKIDLIPANELASRTDRLDALYLIPGAAAANGPVIVDVARRKHLVVISNDPACLDQHCCMLMVRDSGQVEIILDSALAQSAGVTFSSVFAMMVKHR
jgi:hypothetical protein